MVFKIFISYSQSDFSLRGRVVYNYLTNQFPEVHIFIDQSKSKAKKWREENDKELIDCDLMILIITPAALRSDEVEHEIEIAKVKKKSILPCKMNVIKCDWSKLKWDLGSYSGIEFENGEDILTSLYGEIDEIRKEYPKKLQNTSNLSPNSISIQLDNDTYSDGDTIKISGEVKELLSNTPANLRVVSPNNQLVNNHQITINSDKTYLTTFTAEGSLMQEEGIYTVTVRYGSASRMAKTTFNFNGSTKIFKSTITQDTIVVEGSNSKITYTIHGGQITNVARNIGISSLILGIDPIENGDITLTIPRDVLDAQINNVDQDFFVLIDGSETIFSEPKTNIQRTLIIPFLSDSKEIEIIGISQSNKSQTPIFEKQPNSESNSKPSDQTHTILLSTSFDRTVYPLKSKLYIRVNCLDIIYGKTIDIVISNSKNKIIASKEIDPITHPDSELKQAGIYEESFQMNETDMEVNEVYTVRVSHGNAWSEDTCVVDERTPVIETDKSVYFSDSDMILTVIDPDADKDSQMPEFIGDSLESFLTISSSLSSIDGYRLLETGNSTGIFQGIIGLIETFDDGTVVPRNIGNEKISKTQGTGIEDGFLQVKPNDEIKISYRNKSDVITLTADAFFPVVVELNKKVYSWTDKVYITIVAPLLNRDLNKTQKIGNNAESSITIKTRQNKLENYELIENGPDTGVFTGEISLSGFQYDKLDPDIISNFGKSSGKGPDGGMISCDSDDEIFVKFTTRAGTISNSALIRWNIGKIQWMKPTYTISDMGSIRVIDPDMSTNPNLMHVFKIRVWSDSDPVGTKILVVETGPETGIFVGDILFSSKTEDEVSLKVSPGDSVVAEYVDFTLPKPCQKGDSLKITANTQIISH